MTETEPDFQPDPDPPHEPGDDEEYVPGPGADGKPLTGVQLVELHAMEGDPEDDPEHWDEDHPDENLNAELGPWSEDT